MNELEVSNNIIFLINERDLSEMDGEVSTGGVEHVMKNLKNGRTTGKDEIPYEMYK